MELQEILTREIACWRADGISLLPPKTTAQVTNALRQTGCPFAADAVELYTIVGGMEGGGMDENCLSLWPLERLLEEHGRDWYLQPFLAFADFLIDSHYYYLKRKDETTSEVWCDGLSVDLVMVASSLTEFFMLHRTDPNSLGLLD